LLQIITGRAGSGKTAYLLRTLSELNIQAGQKLILLVPEQYSFEMEKAILHSAGLKKGNSILVLSFTRLAELVFRQEGNIAGHRLSDGGRRMIMSLAVSACSENLSLYATAARDSKITDIMLTAVNEMKMCSISPEDLAETAEKLPEGSLQIKLSETSQILKTYEELVAASYLDSRDDLTRLAEILQTSSFFENSIVMTDSFEGFTGQEIRILEHIMQKAEKLVVSLCLSENPQEMGIFDLVNKTRKKLLRKADDNGVSVLPDIHLSGSPRFQNPTLATLEKNLFDTEKDASFETHDGIHIYEAKNIYDEAEYVSATIRRLVMNENYRYKDITIVCRSSEIYGSALNISFQKREIPCFISSAQAIDAEPIMRLVLNAFAVVQTSYRTESILEMLKTGISGFNAEEISMLENYLFTWKISGSAWHAPFAKHPEGFGKEMNKSAEKTLEILNNMRQKLIAPLKTFAQNTRKTTGKQISEAVYQLLCTYKTETHVKEYCRTLLESNETALSEKQVRVWELLMEILNQMMAILGDTPIRRDYYCQLLTEVIQSEDISDIPQVMDSVLLGSPEQIRQSSPKAVFIIGAAQGLFPSIPKASGIFSNSERKLLISEQNLPLTDPVEFRTLEERYLAYSVSSLPSEQLYVSYAKDTDGEDYEAGEIPGAISAIFPNLQPNQNLSISYYANTKEAAFSKMAAVLAENTPQAAALQKVFEDLPEYNGRIKALHRAANLSPEEISDQTLSKSFTENLYLSPSQIEMFYSCKFRYFCRYILKAKERRAAEVDALQYGTIMHHLFENLFSNNKDKIADMNDNVLHQNIADTMRTYADNDMGGYENLSGRERYRLNRMTQSAVVLMRHVSEELAQSQFQPAQLEMRLSYEENEFPPLRILSPEGQVVTVGGTIDRVDVFENERGRFVRVVDYKTGHKDFHLSDVLYGMNMQMLVYLAALAENDEVIPAGILYTPLANPNVSVMPGTDEEKIKKAADAKLRMNGLILSDTEIVRAMEAAAQGSFIPVKIKKSDGTISKTNSAVTQETLSDVLIYVKNMIGTMADELSYGHIAAKPMMHNANSCKYCAYVSVCGREYNDDDIISGKPDHQSILEIMKGGAANGES
jgi:ATP-dependent nuclease, subunit B